MMTVWLYKDANIELNRRAINEFNWTRTFWKTSINKKVNIFNKTVLDILSNFIPHNILTCNDKDPPWFIKKIKGINTEKDNAFKAYRSNSSNTALKRFLRNLQVCLNSSIKCDKEKVYHKMANKFNDTQKNAKSYWSLIKMFLNNNKTPLIPSLFLIPSFLFLR